MARVSEGLSAILRTKRAEALISEAETIRDYPPGIERTAEAEKHVREAMLQKVFGNISPHEESHIFTILNCVMRCADARRRTAGHVIGVLPAPTGLPVGLSLY